MFLVIIVITKAYFLIAFSETIKSQQGYEFNSLTLIIKRMVSMNLPQKPQESTLRLVECISNIGEIYSHNQQVVFCQEIENKRKEFVFAVQEGKVEIYRKNIFIGELSAPCIMGLLQSCFLIDFYHLKPSSDSVMVVTERSVAMEAITQKGLWNDVLNYQAYVFDILLYRRELIIKNSAYSVICNLLEELVVAH